MYEYIKGKIVCINTDNVVVDVNDIGYKVYVANACGFDEGELVKIYLYNHIREDESTLYGFKNIDDRELFLRLLAVKGMGPKTCLGLFGVSTTEGLIDAINRENVLYITKAPKIGEKLARQIILDLKGKFESKNEVYENGAEDLIEALNVLGYKNNDIKRVIKNINMDDKLENQVKEALKLLSK